MHCTGKLYLPRVKLNAAIVPFTEELIGQFRMIMVVSVLVHVRPGNKCAIGKNQSLYGNYSYINKGQI